MSSATRIGDEMRLTCNRTKYFKNSVLLSGSGHVRLRDDQVDCMHQATVQQAEK